MEVITYSALGYLIGSIPFGLIITKLAGLGDVRKIGSGSIGATNVLRTGSKKLAALTLLLDALKGALIPSCIIIMGGGYNLALIAGLAAMIGHCYPIWLKFKGGKGVATAFGVLLAVIPLTGIIAAIIWLLSAIMTRISSLSALIACGLSPLITLYFYGTMPAIFCLLLALLIIWRHHANIKRLINGTEPKIGNKK